MKCKKYKFGNNEYNRLPRYLEHDGNMMQCIPANFEKLGILVRVDATPDEGKTIIDSHGELINGQWVEVIDEQKTPAEIAEDEALAVNVFSKLQVRRAMRELGIENHLDALLASSETFQKDWNDTTELDLSDPVTQEAVASYNAATSGALDVNAIKLKIAGL